MKSSSSSGYTAVPTNPAPPPVASLTPMPTSGYATIPTNPSPPFPNRPSKTTLPQSTPPPSSTAPPPAATPSASVSSFVDQFKQQGKALIATQRPWAQVLDTSAFGRPASTADALGRVRRNLNYFRSNYSLAALGVLGLALLWHPGALFVFIVLAAAWSFLYFFRDQPLVLFNHPINDSTVLVGLTVATIVALIFTDIGSSVSGVVIVCLLLVGLHAAFRKTDDLYLDESEAANGGLVAGSVTGVPANAASQIYVRVM